LVVTPTNVQAEEYKSSFDDIFKKQSLPREASFYVNVPSRVDPTAAPDGKDAVVVLVPVGHLVDEAKTKSKKGKMNVAIEGQDGQGLTQSQDWEALVERARGQVIQTMEARLGVRGLRGMIRWEEVNTPLTCRFYLFLPDEVKETERSRDPRNRVRDGRFTIPARSSHLISPHVLI
jgi:phytoene desaturase (3,4-didehydrolycopene-forming)